MKYLYTRILCIALFFSFSFTVSAQYPVADFEACSRVCEIFTDVVIKDKSLNNPTQYSWKVYDYTNPPDPKDLSTGAVTYNPNAKDLTVSFFSPGIYTVELIVRNATGSSLAVVKKHYIRCMPDWPEVDMPGGSREVTHYNYAAISAYAGFAGNSMATLQIIPDKPAPLFVTIGSLNLKGIDTLRLYNGNAADPGKLIAVLTENDNGARTTYSVPSGKMFVFFSSDAITGARRFQLQYYSKNYDPSNRTQDFKLVHDLNKFTGPVKIYNLNQNWFTTNYYKTWFVNGNEIPWYDNEDTFFLATSQPGTYIVRLRAAGCDTTYDVYDTLVIEKKISGTVYHNIPYSPYCDGPTGGGIEGLKIMLYDKDDNFLASTLSDNTGYYLFPDNLPDTCRIKIDTVGAAYVSCRYEELVTAKGYAKVDFGLNTNDEVDIAVMAVSTVGQVFPGIDHKVTVWLKDLAMLPHTDSLDGVLRIIVSGKVSYLKGYGILPEPDVISGDTLLYNIEDLYTFDSLSFMLRTNINAKIRDVICIKAELLNLDDDNNSNNRMKYCYEVRNSYDPNMKEVYPEDVEPGYDDWFTYTVHFQNTGNAPAHNIVVRDTLDAMLIPETFQVLSSSHSCNTLLSKNRISFSFNGIMLADSMSDEEGSKGYVQYRIKPKTKLPKGTEIRNTAHIYFDYNSPITTNTTVNEYKPKGVIIRDTAFANWLNAHYPDAMYKIFLMDTAHAEIKAISNINVDYVGIKDLYGIEFMPALTELSANYNLLNKLYYMPVSLATLSCHHNRINAFGSLPAGLRSLDCSNNTLSKMDNLPAGLQYLDCSHNKLDTIAKLSASLEYLDCGNNMLSSLPALSNKLQTLAIDSNQLQVITSIPASIKFLHCDSNKLIELPALPEFLEVLSCTDNKINCFPVFSSYLQQLDIAGNPFACIPNTVAAMDAATRAYPICLIGDEINNPDGCDENGLVLQDIHAAYTEAIGLYPNPGKDVFRLKGIKAGEFARLDIYALSGSVIWSGKAYTDTEISLSDIAAGLYIVKLQTVDAAYYSRLVKE